MRQVDACPSDHGMNPVSCFLLLQLSCGAAGAELRRHIREGKKTSRKAEEGEGDEQEEWTVLCCEVE